MNICLLYTRKLVVCVNVLQWSLSFGNVLYKGTLKCAQGKILKVKYFTYMNFSIVGTNCYFQNIRVESFGLTRSIRERPNISTLYTVGKGS